MIVVDDVQPCLVPFYLKERTKDVLSFANYVIRDEINHQEEYQ